VRPSARCRQRTSNDPHRPRSRHPGRRTAAHHHPRSPNAADVRNSSTLHARRPGPYPHAAQLSSASLRSQPRNSRNPQHGAACAPDRPLTHPRKRQESPFVVVTGMAQSNARCRLVHSGWWLSTNMWPLRASHHNSGANQDVSSMPVAALSPTGLLAAALAVGFSGHPCCHDQFHGTGYRREQRQRQRDRNTLVPDI
jgi:hypothetical protein